MTPTEKPEKQRGTPEESEAITDDDLIKWLDAKYARHGEIEDKLAADRLRELSEARAALARDGRDAERYRLWRKNTELIVPSCTEETIDAELDAAIAARGERR